MNTALPDIVISNDDHHRLLNIAEAAANRRSSVAEYLLEELTRATICNAAQDCAPGVRMGSFVEFRDDKTGRVRSVQLVYPAEADPLHDRISVLTPIGAALIGLSEGQSIEWQTRAGEWKTLTVLKVYERRDAPGYLDV
jgi:regulator of nucleoside diphosphate kinase